MKNGSFFIPRGQIYPLINTSEMNNSEGLNLYWETDPAVARRILPPPLELAVPEHPLVIGYVCTIREPAFAPWYMEAGLMLACRYRERAGTYFLGLQLAGPGAMMGLCIGRELCGLPKKLAERIVLERVDDCAHAFVEAKGRRILDVEIELGGYNDPVAGHSFGDKAGTQERSACFVFEYQHATAPDGHATFPKMKLINYDNVNDSSQGSYPGIAARSNRRRPSRATPAIARTWSWASAKLP